MSMFLLLMNESISIGFIRDLSNSSYCYCHNTTFSQDDFEGELADSKCDEKCIGDQNLKCGSHFRIRFVEMDRKLFSNFFFLEMI